MSNKQSHLEMIQGIVGRMSHNSFLLKGWTVILVSALFALAAENKNIVFIIIAYLPCISLWHLDAYFLWKERLFRALYNHVRLMNEGDIDYSMEIDQIDDKDLTFKKSFFSGTLFLFHGVILLSIIIAMLITI